MKDFLRKNFTPFSQRTPCYSPCTDYTDSNAMYDANVGITHIIIENPDGSHRIVSDVEICMTTDPNITSRFSPEYRAQLKNTILSRPHNPISNLDADGNPIGGSVIPNSLERDELASVIESRQSDFHRQAVNAVMAAHAAASEPTPEPKSTES